MFRSSLDTSIKPILCQRKSGPTHESTSAGYRTSTTVPDPSNCRRYSKTSRISYSPTSRVLPPICRGQLVKDSLYQPIPSSPPLIPKCGPHPIAGTSLHMSTGVFEMMSRRVTRMGVSVRVASQIPIYCPRSGLRLPGPEGGPQANGPDRHARRPARRQAASSSASLRTATTSSTLIGLTR